MLEQIYNDFTANVLPKIADGLSITYEYFIDVFGRYIKYLIITDSIKLFISLSVLIAGLSLVVAWVVRLLSEKKAGRHLQTEGFHRGNVKDSYTGQWFAVIGLGILFSSLIPFVIDDAKNLIKSIYIPELRIYEELTNYHSFSYEQGSIR